MTKLLSAFLSFLLFCSLAEGLTFPKHFDIPPITENRDMEDGVNGLYFPKEDRIEVRILWDRYAVVHEVGHSVMWDIDFPVCSSFVSDYAKTNIEEDKAESFSHFFFYREQFRSLAAFDKCLMLKYKKVYRVFYPRRRK